MVSISPPTPFVRKSGDVMSGDLNLGLNSLILNNGVNGGRVRGHPTSADIVELRNIANISYAGLKTEDINAADVLLNGDVLMTPTKTVDNIDVSEISYASLFTYSGATVHSGQVMNDWSTQLDLSGIIGANSALVLLRVTRNSEAGIGYLGARDADDTSGYKCFGAVPNCNVGSSETSADYGMLIALTSPTGILDIKSDLIANWDVWLLAYIKQE